MINRKMFSLKRLFQFSFSVKLQFFKTFVLPYFDYCGTLSIYFTKTVFTKLCNSYYFCLFKLFNFSFGSNANISKIGTFLAKYNIQSFQCRIFVRIASFVHKIYFTQAPSNVYNEIAVCAHPLQVTLYAISSSVTFSSTFQVGVVWWSLVPVLQHAVHQWIFSQCITTTEPIQIKRFIKFR